MEHSVADVFCSEARARLDQFYRSLGELGEVTPVARMRLEGFLGAGLVLALVTRGEIDSWVAHYTGVHLGEEQRLPSSPVLADSDDDGVLVPVRWARAPVHPS